MNEERDFAAHAEKAIAADGVFMTTFSHLDWLWQGQSLEADAKADRIVEFAYARGWRAVPGFDLAEVLFEKRTPSEAAAPDAVSAVTAPSETR